MEYYEILGLQRTATVTEIRQAYRKLSLKYHPDKNPTGAEKFQEINQAYKVLSNDVERQNYNLLGHANYNTSNSKTTLNLDPDTNDLFERTFVYYQFLLLEKNATQEDIESSYKKAIENDYFNKIDLDVAYDILSDINKRKLYDFFGDKQYHLMKDILLKNENELTACGKSIILFSDKKFARAIFTISVIAPFQVRLFELFKGFLLFLGIMIIIAFMVYDPILLVLSLLILGSFLFLSIMNKKATPSASTLIIASITILLSSMGLVITLPIALITKPVYMFLQFVITKIKNILNLEPKEYNLEKFNLLKETLQKSIIDFDNVLLKDLGIEELISNIESLSDITLNSSEYTKIENLINKAIKCIESIKEHQENYESKKIPLLKKKSACIKGIFKQESGNSTSLIELNLIQLKIENLENNLHASLKKDQNIIELITDIKECSKKKNLSTENMKLIKEILNDIKYINTTTNNIEQEQIKLKNVIQECINVISNQKKPIQPTQEPSSTTLNNDNGLNLA